MRHPETAYNASGRYQGGRDVPLNRKGRQQLQNTIPVLSRLPFDLIYTSPLKRCLEVVKRLAEEKRVSVLVDDRLRELNYGVFEGLSRKQIEQRYPALLQKWYSSPMATAFPRGESFRQFIARVRDAVRDIKKQNKSVLVISHGGPIRVFICDVLGLPLRCVRSFQFDNAGLTGILKPFSHPELLFQNIVIERMVEGDVL